MVNFICYFISVKLFKKRLIEPVMMLRSEVAEKNKVPVLKHIIIQLAGQRGVASERARKTFPVEVLLIMREKKKKNIVKSFWPHCGPCFSWSLSSSSSLAPVALPNTEVLHMHFLP